MAAEAARWPALLVEVGGSNAGPPLNRSPGHRLRRCAAVLDEPGHLEPGQPCRIDLTLRPTSHTPKIARAAQPNRCALGQGGALNSAATSGTPRKPARP